MTLQSSGPISATNIAAEFDDTSPTQISEFYGLGTPTLPASDEIRYSDFYGVSAVTAEWTGTWLAYASWPNWGAAGWGTGINPTSGQSLSVVSDFCRVRLRDNGSGTVTVTLDENTANSTHTISYTGYTSTRVVLAESGTWSTVGTGQAYPTAGTTTLTTSDLSLLWTCTDSNPGLIASRLYGNSILLTLQGYAGGAWDTAGGIACNSGTYIPISRWAKYQNTTTKSCPDPNTLINITPTTYARAGALNVGDRIYTMHEHSGEFGYYNITHAETIPNIDKLNYIFDDATNLIASDSHKFYLGGNNWRYGNELSVGDKVVGINTIKTVVDIERVNSGEIVQIEVDGAHTYIAANIISHNIKM
jgi:hypothetical protein